MQCQLVIHFFNGRDRRELIGGARPPTLESGSAAELRRRVPDTGGQPIADVGLALMPSSTTTGTVLLDLPHLGRRPDATLEPPCGRRPTWRHLHWSRCDGLF